MPKFRRKPAEIEAVQFTGKNQDEIVKFAGLKAKVIGRTDVLHIVTADGMARALDGDWIVRNPGGDFYPCRHDIFEFLYEPVTD